VPTVPQVWGRVRQTKLESGCRQKIWVKNGTRAWSAVSQGIRRNGESPSSRTKRSPSVCVGLPVAGMQALPVSILEAAVHGGFTTILNAAKDSRYDQNGQPVVD
jgi:hypothetical protein